MTACGSRRYNFFQPVMRLQNKIVVSVKGGRSRTRRRYDPARTPFDRLCDTDALAESRQAELKARRNATNPRQLREEIYALLDELMALPGADPETTEDIYHTLFSGLSSMEEEDSSVTLSSEGTVPVG